MPDTHATTMDCSFQDEYEATYKVQHFFRNKCSSVLAELLAKELRNCNYVQALLEGDKEGTLDMSLYRLLKTVSSKGKKKAAKKSRCTTEEPSCPSKTQHLNNLKHNEDTLSRIQVRHLLLLQEGHTGTAIEHLSTLDSAFLLWILTNDILDFPHVPQVTEALIDLREIRNSIHHRDSQKNTTKTEVKLLDQLCTKTSILCQYLGKGDVCFKNYTFVAESSYSPVFRELQQEIHRSYLERIRPKFSNQHLTVEPTIKHIRGYCRSDEIVENLMKFLAENQVHVNEEPRPVLLSGAARAGKTSTLHRLALDVIYTEQYGSGSFPLVVMIDEVVIKNRSRENFWDDLFHHLATLCPEGKKKYGDEEVVAVLSSYSSSNSFLFLMDHNLQDMRKLNNLMPHMDRGAWVLSYLGTPDPLNFCRVLKMEPFSEVQVYRLLSGVVESEEECNLVCHLYNTCGYKGLIDTPEMVCIFARVCLEIQNCVPFYELIHIYIYKNILVTDENERQLIKLGKMAFDMIKKNKKYYCETSLNDVENVKHLFLEADQSRGFIFKYRVVEDYLAAKYVVREPKVACASWLSQATLFKRVFEIACAMWSKQENGIKNNLSRITHYLERLFEIFPRQKRRKKTKDEAMDVDEDDGDAHHHNFVRWNFLSKLAKDNENNADMLDLLAKLLSRKKSWLFKCKSVTEKCLDNLSLVFRHVQLTKGLVIKLESGPNVTMLTKLWATLSNHKGVCSNTAVQLVIQHTETNWIMHEKPLAMFPAILAKTTAPLYITKYVGPLLCSGTEEFLKCLCMQKLEVLDVYVCDFGSLLEVLKHRQEMKSVIVRLNLRIEEMKIPNTVVKLSSSFPLNLTITYFEGLQALLDKIEPPSYLSSLRIYRVYIHENFNLDLRRFTDLKLLSIRFLHMGRLPHLYLDDHQSEEEMEVDDRKSSRRVSWLPLEQWALHLVLSLHLPASLKRLLVRNLSFCDDSNILLLNKYWSGLPFQRLVLLDVHLSLSKFKEILQSLANDSKVDDIRENLEKKCRLEEPSASLKNATKQVRLRSQERKDRRQNKRKGKEVIITSEAELCSKCHLLACSCVHHSINHSRDTYRDFIALVNDIYSYEILSISYTSKDVMLRKDLCGDLHVQCPLPFLNDEMAEHPELVEPALMQGHEFHQLLGALALAQAITLTYTRLSHRGALCLLQHLKRMKQRFGSIEPFRLTIFSCHYHGCSMSVEEIQHSSFLTEVKGDDSLQQFNFRCDCLRRCHNFKKSIKGQIYFNDELFP